MDKKGLCLNCNQDATCTFSRQFPVFYCDEFCLESGKKKLRKKRLTKKVKK